jgi:hypothetical protein
LHKEDLIKFFLAYIPALRKRKSFEITTLCVYVFPIFPILNVVTDFCETEHRPPQGSLHNRLQLSIRNKLTISIKFTVKSNIDVFISKMSKSETILPVI